MKNVIISVVVVLSAMISTAQAQTTKEEGVINANTQKSLLAVKYRLFPTQNMWTFIKLNTRNGKMWQVQFDVKNNNRFESDLNILPLVYKEKELDDRFTLYPTQNIYTFILLDQHDGKTWQVQWSIEPENRVIIPIE